jgi:hypothetical protein
MATLIVYPTTAQKKVVAAFREAPNVRMKKLGATIHSLKPKS